ncbi:MAG: 50S ribosomal protein L24 [Candidatus Omnitrophica bacterium]|jgi:large subunit ribosomal protein L24|nr:50S ribosomal protein L24 [Candidatus Omnitrophota bacterium]
MFKIKKGDIIQVTKGKDKGKKGKVLEVLAQNKRAIVEGINQVKKHKRKTKQEQQAGIVSVEVPISTSNIMLVCKQCGKASRVGFKAAEGKEKTRFCKSCKETF